MKFFTLSLTIGIGGIIIAIVGMIAKHPSAPLFFLGCLALTVLAGLGCWGCHAVSVIGSDINQNDDSRA